MCRDGIETPKIEVRYENLSVEGNAYVGDRALPSLYNATFNSIEVHFLLLHIILIYFFTIERKVKGK